ncbi:MULTISPECIES: hypothetical protein [Burkholderiaceae]|uniref:hypothetical protein n=1 Tax=Burkholderiaceae TaxID=119060 RepID=UPI00097726A5|nr:MULTISPECIES: hypothetical protein [Burkholderiaceae]MCG1039965.1 hypothetical protein [Mycetohabitans sp. B7]
MALRSCSFGLFQSPNKCTLLVSAPRERSVGANGMFGTARLTGQAVETTLIALIFNVTGN